MLIVAVLPFKSSSPYMELKNCEQLRKISCDEVAKQHAFDEYEDGPNTRISFDEENNRQKNSE